MKIEIETDMEFNEWLEVMEFAKRFSTNLIWKKVD